MNPSASIVIPMHNGAAHIEQQLNGLKVALTSLPLVEILVVDNRSTDHGPDLVRAWADRADCNVRVVPAHDEPGEPHARNVGWKSAKHETILYCDADDLVSPTWAHSLIAKLQTSVYATGPLETNLLNDPATVDIRGQALFKALPRLRQGVPFAHGCNMGYQRSLLEELGGFDETYLIACDIEIAVRAWHRDIELAWVPEALVHYRLRPEPAAIYRQAHAYARSRRRIDRLLGGSGGLDLGHQARRAYWLMRHLPSLRTFRGRAEWAWVAGQVTGEVGGRLFWQK